MERDSIAGNALNRLQKQSKPIKKYMQDVKSENENIKKRF